MYNNPLQEALQQLNNIGKTSSAKNISEAYTLNGKEIKISDPKNWKEEAPFAAVLGGCGNQRVFHKRSMKNSLKNHMPRLKNQFQIL